jgi:hypothetical protein
MCNLHECVVCFDSHPYASLVVLICEQGAAVCASVGVFRGVCVAVRVSG